ncbi:hypothetical protein K438DRAFT_1750315 [Mycena galopus ATCC 62051]|nr:hypothetical protein K438DRAFT_1750315 [Mycena galopus ATCC 62051]
MWAEDPSIAASVALLLRFQNLASIIDALVDKIVARLPFLHCPFSTVSHPPVPRPHLVPSTLPFALVRCPAFSFMPTQLGSVRVSVSAPCASPIKLTLSEHPRAPRTRLSLPAALEVGKHLEYSITPYVRAAAPSDPHVPPPSDLHINSDTNLSGRVYTDSVRVDISPRRFGGSWFAFSTPSNSMFILSVYLSRDYSREFKTTDKLDPNPTGS